jgi:hypothetical protein
MLKRAPVLPGLQPLITCDAAGEASGPGTRPGLPALPPAPAQFQRFAVGGNNTEPANFNRTAFLESGLRESVGRFLQPTPGVRQPGYTWFRSKCSIWCLMSAMNSSATAPSIRR